MTRYWKLDGHKPVPTDDVLEWAKIYEGTGRFVAQSEICGSRISTVFLGIDHGHGSGSPLLFETMIFDGPQDQYQERCSTWEEAEAQHQEACQLVQRQCN